MNGPTAVLDAQIERRSATPRAAEANMVFGADKLLRIHIFITEVTMKLLTMAFVWR